MEAKDDNRAIAHFDRPDETVDRSLAMRLLAPARRSPRQQRALETVRAILEAAAEVMATEGMARATTNRIAERAGVSIGSLYQYFPNKEAILARLMEEHHADIRATVKGALERLRDPACPLADAVSFVFDEIVALHRRKPVLYRLMAQSEALASDHGSGPEARHAETSELVAALKRRSEIQVANPDIAVHLVLETIGTLARWLVHAVPVGLNRADCAQEAVRMVCGYLGVSPDTGDEPPEGVS